MNKVLKRVLSVMLALLTVMTCFAGITAFAQDEITSNGYTFSVSGTELTVTGYTGTDTELFIPGPVTTPTGNYTTVSVSDSFLASNSSVTKVTIPSQIRSIGSNAFSGCSALNTVTVLGSGVNFASGAFNGCQNLTAVNLHGAITVEGNAFANSATSMVFYCAINTNYPSTALAEKDLAVYGGTAAWTWFNGTAANTKYAVCAIELAGRKLQSTAISIVPDSTKPTGTITIGSLVWNKETSLEGVQTTYYSNTATDAKIAVADNASGIKTVYYINTDTAIANPSALTLDRWSSLVVTLNAATGKLEGTLALSQTKKNIVYLRIEDNSNNVTYINTAGVIVDITAPTVILTNKSNNTNYDRPYFKNEVNFNTSIKTPVEFLVKATDTSNIDKVGYIVRDTAFNDLAELKAATAWTALDSTNWANIGATFEAVGTGSNRIVYVRVSDNAGNVTYVGSTGFKVTDGSAPVIYLVTYRSGKAEEVILENGQKYTFNYFVNIFAKDDIGIKTFTYLPKGGTAVDIKSAASTGTVIKTNNTYTLTATDNVGNKTVATLVINITDKTPSVITASTYDGGVKKDGIAFVNKGSYTYNYPVTIKVTENDKYGPIKYTYTDVKNVKTKIEVSSTTAANGFILSAYGTYEFSVIDAAGNIVKFTLVIKEATHTVSKLAINNGVSLDASSLLCTGGTFSAVVTGTNIYNKIALFQGTTRIGIVSLVGSLTEPMSSATIGSGVYTLPANTTLKPVEYTFRVYTGSTEDKNIISTKGTELKKFTVDAYSEAISVSPTALSFPKAGGTSAIIPTSNTTYSVASSAGWLTLAEGKDSAGRVIINATAAANNGSDRTAVITFKTLGATPYTATVSVSQVGSGVTIKRLSGNDRYTTATAISNDGWTSANTVILANGEAFADALAGIPLSKAADAPILLTKNSSLGLEAAVLNEITRLGAKKVYILGGEAVVSAAIAKTLTGKGLTVSRIYGSDRYATSVAIAKELTKVTKKGFTKLYFANANNYPDALSIGSVAAIEGNPILYLPTTGNITSTVSTYVKSSGCKSGVVLGGTAAVSTAGENSVKALGLTMSRVSGSDRYATALAIAKTFAAVYTGKNVAVAAGTNFPDALSGGAYAAKLNIPVVLVSANNYTNAVTYIKSKSITTLYVFGGTSVVSNAVAEALAVK